MLFKSTGARNAALVAGGFLIGTAGVKILSGKEAKKVYTHCTAAALRAKDDILKTATKIQENCGDIHAEAVRINEERAAAETVYEDVPAEDAE